MEQYHPHAKYKPQQFNIAIPRFFHFLFSYPSGTKGINICCSSSSRGRNGARSSSGGLTSVPSGRRLVALFGSPDLLGIGKDLAERSAFCGKGGIHTCFISALECAQEYG